LKKLGCTFQSKQQFDNDTTVQYDNMKLNCTKAEKLRGDISIVYCKKCNLQKFIKLKRKFRRQYMLTVKPFKVLTIFTAKDGIERKVHLPVFCYCDLEKR